MKDGAEYIATGHYAQKQWDKQAGVFRLLRGRDSGKDQSYFLSRLSQGTLKRVLWPLGGMKKDEVRGLACSWGLPVAAKDESQEICFIRNGDYRTFLEAYMTPQELQPGEIIDSNGQVIGEHAGIHGYTVGQRRGLGIPWREPLYVLRILPNERKILAGPRKDVSAKALLADDVSWVAGRAPADAFEAQARIRYRHTPASALVRVEDAGMIRVTFDRPQAAITPGQAVVLYRDDEVVGSAWIKTSEKE
jgi:tRNA-specific 2-thiouridylase